MWIRFIVPTILIVHYVRAATLLINWMGGKWRAELKGLALKRAVSGPLWKGIDTQLAFNVKSSSLVQGRGSNKSPTRGIELSRLGDAFCNRLPSSGLVLFLFLNHRHSVPTRLMCCRFLELRFISWNP
jgi:hypothetical protein